MFRNGTRCRIDPLDNVPNRACALLWALREAGIALIPNRFGVIDRLIDDWRLDCLSSTGIEFECVTLSVYRAFALRC
jgi:hypothetical protein